MMQNKPFDKTVDSSTITKADLKKRFEQSEKPVKTMLKFCALSGLIVAVVGYCLFLQNNAQFYIFLFFPLWVSICLKYLDSFYFKLGENLSYFHQSASIYFDNYAEVHDEVIYDFLLSYDSNRNDISIQFAYKGQSQKISIREESVPRPYGEQQLVIVAKKQTLPDEFIDDYRTQFDLRDLYEKHYELIKRREKKFYYGSEYRKMRELQLKKITFHLALISQKPR